MELLNLCLPRKHVPHRPTTTTRLLQTQHSKHRRPYLKPGCVAISWCSSSSLVFSPRFPMNSVLQGALSRALLRGLHVCCMRLGLADMPPADATPAKPGCWCTTGCGACWNMLGKGRPRPGFTSASVLACMVLMRVSCWLLLTGTSFCRGV